MTDGDIGWTAGLLDGEGNIRLVHGTVHVRISNTYLPMLVRLRDLWTGSISKAGVREGSTDYVWLATGSLADVVLQTTLPFLSKKRKAAELAIRFYAEVDHNKRSLTEEDVKMRDLYREIIRRANKAGQ